MLIPKELFLSDECSQVFQIVNDNDPVTSANVTTASADDLPNQSKSRKPKNHGYTIRPMRLPLRKHHSFHFQPSQTVAGHMNRAQSKPKVIGPLIYKPYLNESSAFKPISPVRVHNNNDDNHSVPRICGTTLKRHMSNVETYDVSRYNSSSSSSPPISQFYVGHYDSDNNEDADDVNYVGNEDEVDSGNEDTVAATINTTTTVPNNRLIYADLALPQNREERKSERLTNGMTMTKTPASFSRYATLKHRN